MRMWIVVVTTILASASFARAQSGGGVTLRDFTGEWEAVLPDDTTSAHLELSADRNEAAGQILVVERGYFSGRLTLQSEVAVRGALDAGGRLKATFTDAGTGEAAAGTLFRRGEYLIVQVNGSEQGFARPGRPLVQSAAAVPEAAMLARVIAGRVYATSTQASGRGAFVGGRMRVAFCSDGRMEYDVSDLASTPGAVPGQGVDFGSSKSRRGSWSVVLLAGAPVVQASWQGTGTSYSLTAFFDVKPSSDGATATIDGRPLRSSARC